MSSVRYSHLSDEDGLGNFEHERGCEQRAAVQAKLDEAPRVIDFRSKDGQGYFAGALGMVSTEVLLSRSNSASR